MKMLDVGEGHELQTLHGLATAEAPCAINKHGFGPVELCDLLFKRGITDGNVNGTGKRSFSELGIGADI